MWCSAPAWQPGISATLLLELCPGITFQPSVFLTIINNFRGLLDSNYGPHTYVYMSDRWDSLNGTGYWMVGPVDDLSDESFLEDAARSYNMDQVDRLHWKCPKLYIVIVCLFPPIFSPCLGILGGKLNHQPRALREHDAGILPHQDIPRLEYKPTISFPLRFEFKRRCDVHNDAAEVDLVRNALRLPSHLLRWQRQRVLLQLEVGHKSQEQQQEKAKKAAAKTLEAWIWLEATGKAESLKLSDCAGGWRKIDWKHQIVYYGNNKVDNDIYHLCRWTLVSQNLPYSSTTHQTQK